MKRVVIGLAALAFLSGHAEASSVSATVVIDNFSPISRTDPVQAEVNVRGINGPDDFGIDLGFAQADIRTGQMRFLATDGLQSGAGGFTTTRATAEIRDTVTLIGPADGTAQTFTLGLHFDAFFDNFIDVFPVFVEDFSPSGQTGIVGAATLSVTEETPLQNGIVSRTQSSAQLRHILRADVRNTDQNPDLEVVLFPAQTSTNIQNPSTSFPGGISRVTDVRAAFDFANATALDSFIEIDFLVAGAHTFSFEASALGSATGAFGVLAGISSLNTASMGIIIPEGGSFTSASGLFLTEAPNAVVPLPVSAGLLVGALALLSVSSFRRRWRHS